METTAVSSSQDTAGIDSPMQSKPSTSESIENRQSGLTSGRSREPSLSPHWALVQTDDGSRTLYSFRHGETYHSESGAAAEATTVFVDNGIGRLVGQVSLIRVLEIGFGTGLNFLLTAARCWGSRISTRLDYFACDQECVPPEVLRQLKYEQLLDFDQRVPMVERWFSWIEQLDRNGRKKTHDSFGPLQVNLELCDAQSYVQSASIGAVDVIYLDAFSPGTSPELWQREFLQSLFEYLVPGGRLVTYCSKSEVQRRLRSVGFQIEKTPGPAGGKREVLIAHRA